MKSAIEQVTVNDRTVSIRFREVDEVQLTERGSDRQAACVLDALPDRST
jgi:hypothetical protein